TIPSGQFALASVAARTPALQLDTTDFMSVDFSVSAYNGDDQTIHALAADEIEWSIQHSLAASA
ncbi:MAG TPA: hypothetical protein VF074_08445, partial [Pyrinomonadaceae bacterium]